MRTKKMPNLRVEIPNQVWKKAKFWAQICAAAPGVRAVFFSGSFPRGDANEDSDIDFFLVAKGGQIFTARFFVFLVLKLFGQLAKPANHAGKICPNHFISDQNLEICEQDKYAAALFSQNIFLAGDKNIWRQFVRQNQKWVGKFGEKFGESEVLDARKAREISFSRPNFLARKLEKHLKKCQVAKVRRNPDFKISGAKIVLCDDELRFHPRPKNRGI